MFSKDINKASGHWILARMGKKVLRPGGRELTMKLLHEINLSFQDDIVEFAPGIGFTATLAIAKKPHSFVGIDTNKDVIKLLREKLKYTNVNFILGDATNTHLESRSRDKVFGEAMLTMQNDDQKSGIVKEAHRILKKGGLYAIHELCLVNVDVDLKSKIQYDLATTIRVNARPLTQEEWEGLLINEGFNIKKIFTNDMFLLEPRRVIADEGFFRAIRIGLKIMANSSARRRIKAMRKVFRKYQNHIMAIAIIAEK